MQSYNEHVLLNTLERIADALEESVSIKQQHLDLFRDVCADLKMEDDDDE